MAYQSVNPYDGKILKTFKELTDNQLETALGNAATCFDNWRHTTFAGRAAVVTKAAAIMRARTDEIALPLTIELIEVAGEPFLAHQLRLLRRHGFERVVLCVGYLGEKIGAFAGDGRAFGLHVEYAFDGPQLLGTAGALRRGLPLLGDAFAVIYGDSYLPCDYRAALAAFSESGKLGLMSVYRNEGLWDTSNVEFTGGRILAYDKATRTPAMHHIDYGLGVLQRAALRSEEHTSELQSLR